ncbi:MAG: CoA-binding protein [Sphingobacteriales bacterium]|nr:MAG: CoA-binding protein [Sphingobacteriales bacterium]
MIKTLVLGATPNADRFAYRAVISLLRHGHEVVPVGRKKGEIGGLSIQNNLPESEDIHTVTLYLNPSNQKEYYDYILGLDPKRIIFNPGTENNELEKLAQQKGIETVEGCTLVMLSTGQY